MMPTLSTMVALDVLIMTTCGVADDISRWIWVLFLSSMSMDLGVFPVVNFNHG